MVYFFLCFLSAVLLILSFLPTNFSWFSWIAFLPLFFSLKNKSKKQAFWLSYLWGIFFWAGLIYWLVKVTLLGYIFLILYLAIYSGVFGILFNLVTDNWFLVSIPCIWVSLEYLRSQLFTGFGWALLGYTQYKNLPLIQIADVSGAYGISFLIVLVNGAIFSVVSSQYSAVSKMKKSFSSLISLSLVLAYGYYKIYQASSIRHQVPLKLCLIQANIPPYQKWDEELKKVIIEKYILLSRVAAKKNPHFIIWPETAFPGFWEEEKELREKVLNLVREINTAILVGAPTLERNLSYNSAILISEKGEENFRYRKIHLVPFGEYIPFPRIFGFLQKRFSIGDYSRGKEYTVYS
ncbi:MAG: apolipoprotein N-acyltransferase [Candidatus Omnitrophica bacterium]|nr:apolipoprotein N-acyltransferase [Candidatus Omnitrophota bacterium]